MSPEVGTGGVAGLSLVEEEREVVVLWCGVQGESGGDGDAFTHEAE